MTTIEKPICLDCVRYRSRLQGPYAGDTRPGLFCDAYPDGIPDAIKASRADHREPFAGDHGLQFLAKSPEAAADAARIIDEAHIPDRPVLRNVDLSNDWLYAWGDLPTTLAALKTWLKAHNIAVEDFKNSARYEANYDEFPWLKDL